MEQRKIAIVILNWNGRKMLEREQEEQDHGDPMDREDDAAS